MRRILRIGRGRSKSGLILDKDTQWLSLNTKEEWKYAATLWANKYFNKPIFLSVNGKAYKEIKKSDLLNIGKTF